MTVKAHPVTGFLRLSTRPPRRAHIS
ncbi:MAG: hypothetical protein QOE76_4344, partial [Frankiales bacterium]|nr:hypothetical protein [Frankiales bacterium]